MAVNEPRFIIRTDTENQTRLNIECVQNINARAILRNSKLYICFHDFVRALNGTNEFLEADTSANKHSCKFSGSAENHSGTLSKKFWAGFSREHTQMFLSINVECIDTNHQKDYKNQHKLIEIADSCENLPNPIGTELLFLDLEYICGFVRPAGFEVTWEYTLDACWTLMEDYLQTGKLSDDVIALVAREGDATVNNYIKGDFFEHGIIVMEGDTVYEPNADVPMEYNREETSAYRFGEGFKVLKQVITTDEEKTGMEYIIQYAAVTPRMSIAVGVGTLAYKLNVMSGGKEKTGVGNYKGESAYSGIIDGFLQELGAPLLQN